MTMTTKATRAGLLITAAALCLTASAAAQVQPILTPPDAAAQARSDRRPAGLRSARDGSIRQRVLPTVGFVSTWAVSLDGTYSDNYRRLPETIDRTFGVADGDGGLTPLILGELVEVEIPIEGLPEPLDLELIAPVRPNDRVDIEPPDNIIGTLSVQGGTVYDRPGLTGIVQGSLSVVGYTDTDTLDQRLAEPLGQDIEDGLFDELFDLENAEEFLDTGLFLPGSVEPVDTGALLPTLTPTAGRGEIEDVFIQPNLRASATARVVPDLFYVDASAVAQQEALALRNELQEEGAGRLQSQVTFAGGSLSPYVFREMTRGSTVEARYRFSTVQVLDESRRGTDPFDPGLGGEDQRFTNDSVAHEGLLEYRSGELLGRLGFAVRVQGARTDEDGSDVLSEIELGRLSGSGEVSYAVTRELTVLAEAGYDDVSLTLTDPRARLTATDPNDPDADPVTGALAVDENELTGFFWRTGIVAVPGRRTRAAVSVGERFGGTLIEADVSYEPTARLGVTLTAQRSLATGAQDQLAGLGGLNIQTLFILDRLAQVQATTSQQLLEQVVSFSSGFNDVVGQQFGAGAFNRYAAGINYNRPRTSFSASVDYFANEFAQAVTNEEGVTEQVDSDNANLSFNAAAQHVLSRRFSVQANARYLQTDGLFINDLFLDEGEGGAGPDGADTDQLFLSVGGAYQVGPRLSLTARAYRLTRTGGPRLEFDENAIGAGVRFAF
jgi:hypothetical protein